MLNPPGSTTGADSARAPNYGCPFGRVTLYYRPVYVGGQGWPGLPANAVEPVFVVEAVGDADGNGERSRFMSSSFNGEIYVENEYE